MILQPKMLVLTGLCNKYFHIANRTASFECLCDVAETQDASHRIWSLHYIVQAVLCLSLKGVPSVVGKAFRCLTPHLREMRCPFKIELTFGGGAKIEEASEDNGTCPMPHFEVKPLSEIETAEEKLMSP